MPASDGGDDFVGIGGPGEGPRLLIVLIEEAVDRGLQVGDGAKDAALEPALCQGREEALDRVEPRSVQDRPCERPRSARKRTLAEGVGCANCRPSFLGGSSIRARPLCIHLFLDNDRLRRCRWWFWACVMESSAKITAAVFAAHLRCPTEARLLMLGETPSHTFFSDMRKKISAAQRTKFATADLFGFSEFLARPKSQTGVVLIDSDTSYLEASQITSKTKRRSKGAEPGHDYVPVLYSPWENAKNPIVSSLRFAPWRSRRRQKANRH